VAAVGAAVAVAAVVLALAREPAAAAFELEWPDARGAALGRTGPGGAAEAAGWLFETPSDTAAAARGPRWSASFSGGELYGLAEARGAAAEAGVARDDTRAAVRAATLGSRRYEERTVAAEVGRRLSDDLACWLRVRVLGIAAEGYDGLWSCAVDARIARRAAGRLVLAAGVENAGGARIGGSPVATAAGASAALALDGATLEAGVRAEAGLPASSSLAVEAAAGAWLRVRASATSEPGTVGLGIGIGREGGDPAEALRRPVVDAAWTWHPELGVSTFVTVRFGR